MKNIVSFEVDILKGLKLKNPDLLNAFVCLGLAAGADGVAVMTAPGPLAHIKHKRRAGMISALVAAGLVKRAPGGYLIHGVGSGETDNGQTEDTEPTAAREASHCNASQNNSGWTEDRQTKDSEPIPEEESEAHALVDLAPGEPCEELSHGDNAETTGDGQTEDTEPTAAREASHCNASQNNSGWTAVQQRENGGDIEALETLLDTMATKETIVDPEEITIDARALALARRAWEIMPDNVKARVDHDFDAYWQQSKSQHIRAAANA